MVGPAVGHGFQLQSHRERGGHDFDPAALTTNLFCINLRKGSALGSKCHLRASREA